MISIFFYTFFLMNLMLVFALKKSNLIAFAYWIILLLVFAGNARTGFSDLAHYAYAYSVKNSTFYFSELGYGTIADWFANGGYSFHVFLAFIFCFCSLFIWISTKKLECNYNFLLVLYSLFYIFYCMEGLRFFLAMSILVCAYYVLSYNTKQSVIFSLLLFVFAFLFHNQSLFLMPFIVFYKIKNVKRKRNILIFLMVLFVGMNLINNNSINYLLRLAPGALEKMIRDYDISTYMSSSTRFGFILYDMYFIFNIIIATMLYRIPNIVSLDNKRQLDFLYMNYQANLYSIIYIPLVMFNVTFFRFTLINCNFNFIALAMVMGMKKEDLVFKSKNWAYCVLALIAFTVLWWILRENVMWFFEALIPNIFN